MSGTSPDSVQYPIVGYGVAVPLDEGTGTYNYAVLTESDTGQPVRLLAKGVDANIPIEIVPKGTATVIWRGASSFGTVSIGTDKANSLTMAGGNLGAPVTFTTVGGDASPDVRFVLPSRGLVNIPRLAVGNDALGSSVASPRVFTLTSAPGLSGTGGSMFRVDSNVFGTNVTASLAGYYIFAADTDNLTFLNTSNGMTLNYRGHTLSSGWSGGRTTDFSFLQITAAGTSGATAYHVSGGSEIRMAASAGGVPGAARGSTFARNEIAQVQNGAGPHQIEVFGSEIDVAVEAEAGVLWKGGVKVVYLANDAKRGLQQDYAYSINMQASSTSPGPVIAYGLGGVEGWFPLNETAHVMEAITEGGIVGGPAPAIGAGIDFSNLRRIRESAFKSIGFKVDGLGNLGALVASGDALQTRSAVTARTAVVASIEVLDGGLYGGTISIALTGTATAAVNVWGIVSSFLLTAAGTGYAVGNTFAVAGGTATGLATFTASIADNVLTVTAVASGTITVNSVLVGGIDGTRIIALGTGTGGTGTYILDTSQTQASKTFTAAGPALGVVTSVNGTGGVTGFRITNPGRYTVLPASPVATTATSGSGSGFTFTPATTILGVSVTAAGSNYSEFLPPTAAATGSLATYRSATFKVNMTGTQGPLALNPGGAVQITAAALGNYANDAAAAAGGVPVNGIYRNASALMVRVA